MERSLRAFQVNGDGGCKMEFEGDKIVRPLINILKFGGLWFDFSGHKHGGALRWVNVSRNAVAFIVWAVQICYFFTGGLSYLLTESGVFVPISFDEGCMAIIVLCNQKTIREIVVKYRKRFETFGKAPWAQSIIDAEMNKFNRIFQLPKITLFVFFCFYSIAPLVYDGIVCIFTNKETPYIVPLPLNFLMDLPLRRTGGFYTVVYLSYIYLLIIVVRFIAFEALVLYLVAFVVIDVKILMRKMEVLSNKDDGSVLLQEEWHLKDVIDHHSSVVNIVQDHFWLLGFALMLQNLSFAVASCLVIYLTKTVALKVLIKNKKTDTMVPGDGFSTLMHGTTILLPFLYALAKFISIHAAYLFSYNNGDFVLAIFSANFIVLMMILNLMFNGAGVIIENQGALLLTSIYNTGWYKQPPKVRKEINAMLRQGLKLLKISYKLSPVNLEAAMVVVNRAYSFFTLINTSE